MDPISFLHELWRYKLVTIPVILLTFLGAVYVAAIKPPVYQASSSYLLISPPGPPSEAQIAQNPALGQISTDNPYTRFGDESVVAQLLSQSMMTDSERAALVKVGADSRYVVTPSEQFGGATPIVQITAVGASAQAAINATILVSRATLNQLNQSQAYRGVDPRYRITTLQVGFPNRAQLQASGKSRSLIAVLGAGVILLFLVMSVRSALAENRSALTKAGREHLADEYPPATIRLPHGRQDLALSTRSGSRLSDSDRSASTRFAIDRDQPLKSVHANSRFDP